jgi:hypothetical protein
VAEGGDVVAEGVGDGEPEAVVGLAALPLRRESGGDFSFGFFYSKGHIQRDRQNSACHLIDRSFKGTGKIALAIRSTAGSLVG